MESTEVNGPLNEVGSGPGFPPSEASCCTMVVHALPSGVVALDRHGLVLTANPAAERFLGLAAGSLRRGIPFWSFWQTEPFREMVEALWSAGKALTRRELTLEQGEEARILGASVSFLMEGGRPGGVILIFTDLTRVRELEAVAETNRQLAQIGELTAGVAHELRNPLGVIGGMAELIARRAAGQPVLEEPARGIVAEVRQMERLIAHFLDFAKPFSLETRRCSVEEVAEHAVKLVQPVATKAGVVVRLERAEIVAPLLADEARLAQSLCNLIQNAVDVTPRGEEVRVRFGATEEHAFFQVFDRGPGVRVPKGKNIFAPFYSNKEGGTGLGLPIAMRIADAHGGRITYTNLPNRGACFELRVPVAPPRPPEIFPEMA
ncbi:MAG TPA: ATP-binding protein [Candidatus Hydrogenedentes bacterium]|nr:ATP-binding protein [Candidatus Hydrogenedentota bacterium]